MPTRREMLGFMGATAAVLALGCRGFAGAPPCIVRPEQMEGPYFVADRPARADIRAEPSDGSMQPGVPLEVTFRVHRIEGTSCLPLPGMVVDLWHCDAFGVYSGVRDPMFNTRDKRFLRGYQRTDGNGVAKFLTIYPGWYPGRTVHLHFKIRSRPPSWFGYDFTSQIYFDESITDDVHQQAPYQSRGRRTVLNHQDGIFRRGGDRLMLPVAPAGDGYAGTFDIGLRI
ncbi:MAG: intradiol ring-cleavage dioxygenase [Nitrospirota bacterium]